MKEKNDKKEGGTRGRRRMTRRKGGQGDEEE